MSTVLSSLLSIAFVSHVSARTCCYYITSQSACEQAFQSSTGLECEYYAPGSSFLTYDPISSRAINCRSLGWAECQSEDPPARCASERTATVPSETECSDLTEEAQGSSSDSALPEEPDDHTVEQIADSLDDSCLDKKKNPFTNCWDQSKQWKSPNTLSFKSKTHDVDGGCCYTFNSVYTGAKDCNEGIPEQSHISLMVDCEESKWNLTSNNADTTTYGSDSSTCYKGIKFDIGCDDGDCDYTVCVKYSDELIQAECPVADGWIMNKASTAYTFAKLEKGVPSCGLSDYHKRQSSVVQNHLLAVERINNAAVAQSGFQSVFMYAGAFAFILLCFALWYWSRNAVAKKSIAFSQTGYDTFSDQRV